MSIDVERMQDSAASIKSHVEPGRILELTQKLVEIESHSLQSEGIRDVATVMVEQLESAGFSCNREPLIEPGDDMSWMAELFLPGRRYRDLPEVVVARRSGTGPRVLLLGDLDTAYPAGSLDRFPFQVDGDRAFGPGVADMKGGLSVLAEAVGALGLSGLSSPEICVVLSPDEQAGSLGSRPIIEREVEGTDYCFSMECAREGGKLLVERAQCGAGIIEILGREGHAGSAFGTSIDAIAGLGAAIRSIDELADPGRGIVVAVTMVEGGRRRSVIAGRAGCVVDIRARCEATWSLVAARLRREVERAVEPCEVKMNIGSHRPAVNMVNGSEKLRDVVISAHRNLGEEVGTTVSAAGGSSAFAGGAGIPTMDGMGPVGGGLMTDQEFIEVGSLGARAIALALSLNYLADDARTAATS